MIGLLLILIGLLIRFMAIVSLKGSFTFHIKKPAWICKSGVYKYVRHPAYVGTLFMIIGLSLISTVAGISYVGFMFFLSRAINEESILDSKEYREYKSKTGMFLPKLRR